MNKFLIHFVISEIRKNLTKIVKDKNCEELTGRIQPCINHLHWSAVTTPDDNRKDIWAKFKSFLSHVTDKDTDLDEPLFNKCAHEENLACRKYLDGLYILYVYFSVTTSLFENMQFLCKPYYDHICKMTFWYYRTLTSVFYSTLKYEISI